MASPSERVDQPSVATDTGGANGVQEWGFILMYVSIGALVIFLLATNRRWWPLLQHRCCPGHSKRRLLRAGALKRRTRAKPQPPRGAFGTPPITAAGIGTGTARRPARRQLAPSVVIPMDGASSPGTPATARTKRKMPPPTLGMLPYTATSAARAHSQSVQTRKIPPPS